MNNKPTKGVYLETLLRSNKTIFSIQDVSLMWSEENQKTISIRLNKYVKSGKLIKLRRGLFAKDENYDQFELATRVCTPSYVSFETVLTREGVNFQYYGNIFVASYINREINIHDQKINFIRIKDYVLSNMTGIENNGNYSIATRERAFLDRIYVSKSYYFDNLDNLNWDKVFEYLPMYNNKQLNKTVKKYFDNYQKNK